MLTLRAEPIAAKGADVRAGPICRRGLGKTRPRKTCRKNANAYNAPIVLFHRSAPTNCYFKIQFLMGGTVARVTDPNLGDEEHFWTVCNICVTAAWGFSAS